MPSYRKDLKKYLSTHILPLVRKPGRYLGTEVNAACRPWHEARVRFCLLFPDLYEIGMSHLGLHILYSIINDTSWALADRAYCPDTDLEHRLRHHNLPLWGLETGKGLKEFDVLAITLPYELCYSNILTMLDLAGIPLFSRDRMEEDWPLVLGGGSCSVQPEPVADFFDAILVGDGEGKIMDIAATLRDARGQKCSKEEILKALARITGIYVPSLYESKFSKGLFAGIEPKAPEVPEIVHRSIAARLEDAPFPSRPLLPTVNIVHDRLGLEIARGCTRGCRFCQAGITYRPVRERSAARVLEMAEEGLESTGWEELSLLSLSTGDYGCITPLIEALATRFLHEKTAVSLPSLRVGTLTPRIMELIRGIRKTGFTLAPEAGSERLRMVINKGITEEDLLETAEEVYKQGWRNIKLYFMIGLPTETMEDITAIAELARKVLSRAGGGRVTVSVGTFVPKPHTPFQWESQISPQESRERLDFLKKNLGPKAIKLKWHDPRQSFLEGIFSRGDRRLARVILKAWASGARLDAWTDRLNPGLYLKAAEDEGLDIGTFLAGRAIDEPLPWDHISTGVKKSFLESERRRAHELAYTSDCRRNKCHKCGVCDFKRIKPVVQSRCSIPRQKGGILGATGGSTGKQQVHTMLVTYSKLDSARFLGHLDILHAFHRAVRRAGIPVAYSEGFHPKPKISFGQPVPLGTESLVEQAAIILDEPVSEAQAVSALNETMPQGLCIEKGVLAEGRKTITPAWLSCYLVLPWGADCDQLKKGVEMYHNSPRWPIEIKRKRRWLSLDAKETIEGIWLVRPEEYHDLEKRWEPLQQSGHKHPCLLRICLRHGQSAQIKPVEFAKSLLNLTDEEAGLSRIIKILEKRP